jgi:hypothetical protein
MKFAHAVIIVCDLRPSLRGLNPTREGWLHREIPQ